MPQIPSSDINEMLQYPDENGLTDIKLIWNREEDGLPVNFQEGTTCGIYALHAATKVLNKHYAPPTTQETGGGWRLAPKMGRRRFYSVATSGFHSLNSQKRSESPK